MYSKHAQVRMQQRGIPPIVVDCLKTMGARAYDHHGGRIRYFDHAGWRRLERTWGEEFARKFDRFRDTYLVETPGGEVMTVGHKFRRIQRT
jgi:hypothetical protein